MNKVEEAAHALLDELRAALAGPPRDGAGAEWVVEGWRERLALARNGTVPAHDWGFSCGRCKWPVERGEHRYCPNCGERIAWEKAGRTWK